MSLLVDKGYHKLLDTFGAGLLDSLVAESGIREFVEVKHEGASTGTNLFFNAPNYDSIMDVGAFTKIANDTKATSYAGALLRSSTWTLSRSGRDSVLTNARIGALRGSDVRAAPNEVLAAGYRPILPPSAICRSLPDTKIDGQVVPWQRDNTLGYSKILYHCRPDSESILGRNLRSWASIFGYSYSSDAPVFLDIHAAGNRSYSDKVWGEVVDGVWNGDHRNDDLRLMGFVGYKYIYISFSANILKGGGRFAADNEAYLNPNHAAAFPNAPATSLPGEPDNGAMVLAIPVIDDGLDRTLWYHACLKSEYGKHSESAYWLRDDRYAATGYSRGGLSHSAAIATKFNMTALTARGALAPATTTTQMRDGQYARLTNMNLIPLSVLPGKYEALYVGQTVVSTVDFTHVTADGSSFPCQLTTVKFDSTAAYAKFPRAWYLDYSATGFGLYKPRDEKRRKEVEESWAALEYEGVSVARYAQSYALTTSMLDSMPLRKEYKRAREKACKTDNWKDQRFNASHKWGEAYQLAENDARRSAFFGVFGSGTAPLSFNIDANEVTVSQPSADEIVTSSSNSELAGTFRRNNEGERDKLLDILGGANVTFTGVVDLKTFFGEDVMSMLNEAKGANSASVDQLRKSGDKVIDGMQITEQYYYRHASLNLSGYPVMTGGMRDPWIYLNSEWTLSSMGANLLRIWDDFTQEAILAKI